MMRSGSRKEGYQGEEAIVTSWKSTSLGQCLTAFRKRDS